MTSPSTADTASLVEPKHREHALGARLLLKRLSPLAIVPGYQTALSAGMDLAACLPDGPSTELTVNPGQIVKVSTGWAMQIEPGYEGQVRPRSGLATKHGLTVVNAPGTIDADYRGEVQVALINLGKEAVKITHGMRIAQLVIAPVMRAQVMVVETLDETQRGVGGFGSTGVESV
ncbi:MAG: dUTP diphosphatase [Phycisphaerales bacterium]|nr:dUTP diphosphatase [Phycisphaerales bacterium]